MRTRRSGAARLALASICLLALALIFGGRVHAGGRSVVEVRVDGVINPVKARLVARAVARAEQQGAELLLVTIDTPGGLVVSMQQIVSSLTNTRVPVIA